MSRWNALGAVGMKEIVHVAVPAATLAVLLSIDTLKTPALYFGTTTGQIWMGRDGGEEWTCLFDSLPPVHSVKVAVI